VSNEVHIGGSTYGPIAVGRGAKATQRDVTIGVAGDDGLEAALGVLLRLIDEHRSEIPEADRAIKDVATLRDQVGEDDPDPDGLLDTIKRIGRRVAMAGAVVAAVKDVQHIIEGIFS
jgi:hypothetical protein